MNLYEILVPTIYGDTKKPIRTRHHKVWDEKVRKITGGLTVCSVAKGQWVNPEDGEIFAERVIPVRVACSPTEMHDVAEMTKEHYRQIAVMYYLISNTVTLI